ncbi:MAG: hypothetical protein ACFFAJ_05020 [Candidatus Hodarchaeota archaeon]
MSKGNILVIIFSSFIVSSIVTTGAILLILPAIYPELDSTTISNGDSSIGEGLIIQSKYLTIASRDQIYDDETVYREINETESEIKIQNQSIIGVLFTSDFMLSASSSYTEFIQFEVMVQISLKGFINLPIATKSLWLQYYSESTGGWDYQTDSISINIITPPLNNGTYIIAAYWRSRYDRGGVNKLQTSWMDLTESERHYSTRTLWILEFSSLTDGS